MFKIREGIVKDPRRNREGIPEKVREDGPVRVREDIVKTSQRNYDGLVQDTWRAHVERVKDSAGICEGFVEDSCRIREGFVEDS